MRRIHDRRADVATTSSSATRKRTSVRAGDGERSRARGADPTVSFAESAIPPRRGPLPRPSRQEGADVLWGCGAATSSAEARARTSSNREAGPDVAGSRRPDRIYGDCGNNALYGGDGADPGERRSRPRLDRGRAGTRHPQRLAGKRHLLRPRRLLDRIRGGLGFDRARIDLGRDVRTSVERLF